MLNLKSFIKRALGINSVERPSEGSRHEFLSLFKGEINYDLAPSVFCTEGKIFIGDYLGKSVHGYEYEVKGGILILDNPATIIRTAIKEEVQELGHGKPTLFRHMQPIVYIGEMA